jgi:hypothetical protein
MWLYARPEYATDMSIYRSSDDNEANDDTYIVSLTLIKYNYVSELKEIYNNPHKVPQFGAIACASKHNRLECLICLVDILMQGKLTT